MYADSRCYAHDGGGRVLYWRRLDRLARLALPSLQLKTRLTPLNLDPSIGYYSAAKRGRLRSLSLSSRRTDVNGRTDVRRCPRDAGLA